MAARHGEDDVKQVAIRFAAWAGFALVVGFISHKAGVPLTPVEIVTMTGIAMLVGGF